MTDTALYTRVSNADDIELHGIGSASSSSASSAAAAAAARSGASHGGRPLPRVTTADDDDDLDADDSAATTAAGADDDWNADDDDTGIRVRGLSEADGERDGERQPLTRTAPQFDEPLPWLLFRWLRRALCCCCLCSCGCDCFCRTDHPSVRAAEASGARSAWSARVSRVRRYVCALVCMTALAGACVVSYAVVANPMVQTLLVKPCLTDPVILQGVRDEVVELCALFDAHNLTYWLDYGTALGAWRRGDVLPWDHDADIGILVDSHRPDWAEWHHWLYQIRQSVTDAHNGTDVIDLFLWHNTTTEREPTRNRLHRVDEAGTPAWWNDRYNVFDWPLITPTVPCAFAHGTCKCMNDFKAQAKQRYPETWYMSIPYRPRCLLSPSVIWYSIWTFNFRYLFEGLFGS